MKEPTTEVKLWWRKSFSDYSVLSFLVKIGKYDTCSFLSQQTAEKAQKANLFNLCKELPLTFSILNLCELAAQYKAEFSDSNDLIKSSDFYYIEDRYPNAVNDGVPAEF